MGISLNILLQQEPGEEAKGQLPALARNGVDIDRIYDLFWRDEDVLHQQSLLQSLTDGSKVFGKTVTDENTAEVNEETQLLVSDLEGDEGVWRVVWVEIAIYTSARTTTGNLLLIPENSVK